MKTRIASDEEAQEFNAELMREVGLPPEAAIKTSETGTFFASTMRGEYPAPEEGWQNALAAAAINLGWRVVCGRPANPVIIRNGTLARIWLEAKILGIDGNVEEEETLDERCAKIIQEMSEDGFENIGPLPGGFDGRVTDAQHCEAAVCNLCRHLGLVYMPFTKGNIYNPMAVCPNCGHVYAF